MPARTGTPFYLAEALFVVTFAGFGISTYPYMVPHELTIWDAAAPDTSLKFLLVGTVVLLPIIVAYTAHCYWVFPWQGSRWRGVRMNRDKRSQWIWFVLLYVGGVLVVTAVAYGIRLWLGMS